MLLRDVVVGDVDAYVRMRCDPVMMAELGGPLPREGMADKVRRDAEEAAAGIALSKMIVVGGGPEGEVAGHVTVWSHDGPDGPVSEIGWMVLPEFQGRGIGKRAVRAVLDVAWGEGRWGEIHAFPAVTNGPSNGICRSLGFRHVGEVDMPFADRVLRSSHWAITPSRALP